jgi:hypothetical protein
MRPRGDSWGLALDFEHFLESFEFKAVKGIAAAPIVGKEGGIDVVKEVLLPYEVVALMVERDEGAQFVGGEKRVSFGVDFWGTFFAGDVGT